jgi:hypothetical protein
MAGVEVFGLCNVCGAHAFQVTDTCWSCGKHDVRLYPAADHCPAPMLIDESTPGPLPTPEVRHSAHGYSGAGPAWAICLEGIALLFFWPGLLSDTLTFKIIPTGIHLYTAILFSVALALGSCAALLLCIRARRTDKPGVAATLALAATLSLVFSVVVGWGPTDDINRACGNWLFVNPCAGRFGAVGMQVIGGIFWLLATLTALGTMIGSVVGFARMHPFGVIVHRKHSP